MDIRNPDITAFLFQFMPHEEWNLFARDSRIQIGDICIGHPIEANIWQMPQEKQREYLASIKRAGCNQGKNEPKYFIDWIYWKLGERIAIDYMIPYNRKMFGEELNALGTYWLEKLPNVSYEDTVKSCEEGRAYGKQPGHAKFLYPKQYGYGELWRRMADAIKDHIIYNTTIKEIDFEAKQVISEQGESFKYETLITTIPWAEYSALRGMPDDLLNSIGELKHTSVWTKYYTDSLDTDAHWIYFPNAEISYHRILVRHNFCPNSRGYWTETNASRMSEEDKIGNVYFNQYAYPLNTVSKPAVMKRLLDWCEGRQVYGVGRWGEHQHYNSDIVVERAMAIVERIGCM